MSETAKELCPSENTIAQVVARELSAPEIARVGRHIDVCDDCRDMMAVLARASMLVSPGETRLERPARIGRGTPDFLAHTRVLGAGRKVGRYEVVRVVGAGGMGVVYEARDPQLERPVALKLIRPGLSSPAQVTRRLARESRALAKLSHPNVVTVYDIGELDGELFIAMELVDGVTLTEWRRAQPRSIDDILRVFRDAALGLEAAHDAGLVHRDFKPDNVLIDRDGRVRVTDFGLARLIDGPAGEPTDELEPESAHPEVDQVALDDTLPAPVTITRTGVAVGTPAYMAPEQHRGGSIDQRTDIFIFCIALYEAATGQRPFVGRTHKDLADAVAAGQVAAYPKRCPAPHWLRRAIARGLEVDPDRRYQSMGALIAALAPPRRKRIALVAAIAVIAAGGAAGFIALTPRGAATVEPCADSRDQLAGVWNEPRQRELRAAFLSSGLAHAAEQWALVETTLDRYTDRWVEMRRDTCMATRRGEQSTELLDVRMHCLDRALYSVGQVAGLVAAGDVAFAEHALAAAEGLPRLDRCTAAESLEARVPVPADPDLRAQVERLRQEIIRADVLRLGGQFAQAADILEPLVDRASKLGYRPIEAEVLYRLGVVQGEGLDPKRAIATLRKAAHAAEAGRNDEYAAESWMYLVALTAEMGDLDRAREYADLARAALERVGDSPDLEGRFHQNIAQLHYQAEEYDQAMASFRRAADLFEKLDADFYTAALEGIGIVLGDLGKLDEARRIHEQVLASRLQTLAPDHPDVAQAYLNLATDLSDVGEAESALEKMLAALAIMERIYPPDHIQLAHTAHNVGELMRSAGRHAEALVYHAKAHAAFERIHGKQHPDVARSLEHQGGVLLDLGRTDEAVDLEQRAFQMFRDTLGEASLETARCRINLGDALRVAGDYEAAIAHELAGMASFEAVLGKGNVYTGYPLQYIGRTYVDAGKPREAIEPLQRAIAVWESGEIDPGELSNAKFWLGRALYESGRNRERGKKLATDARDELAAAGRPRERDLAAANAWLERTVSR